MKRDTRELILATALELFNEQGETRVTTNHIADEADISPGNLYYHFRSKDDIVVELFKRFLVQFEPLLDVPEDSELQVEDLWLLLHLSFELKGKFRFLYRNLPDLCSRIDPLQRAFRGLLERERQAAADVLDNLAGSQRLRLEPIERELLLNNMMVLLTQWITHADLFDPEGMQDARSQSEAIAGVMLLVMPYLDEQDHASFRKLAHRYLA